MKRDFAAAILRATGAGPLLARSLRWSGLVVLTYHRIGRRPASLFDRGIWSASAEAFDAQIRLLKSACDVITPEELPGLVACGKGRYALLTFDDGYLDVYQT
jgi:hypothetical protein